MKILRSLLLGALLTAFAAGPAFAQAFGYVLAAGDDEIMVGEPLNDITPGAVHVYRRGADRAWAPYAVLNAADGTPGDYFGRALAVQGGTMFIGATVADESTGATYLFEKDASGEWKQVARLQPEDLAEGDSFGRVAAIDGDFAVIASLGYSDGRGGGWVYRRGANGAWSEAGKLQGTDLQPREFFGFSLAISGDRIVVGVPLRDSRPSGDEAAAESEQADVAAADEGDGEDAGDADEGEAAEGEDAEDAEEAVEDVGAAYVFERDAATGTWNETAILTVDDADANALFGWAVGLDGDAILVGAPGVNGFTGIVYRFERDDSGEWERAAGLLPYEAQPNSWFGSSIAVTGPEIWVGARGARDGEGRAYLFHRDEATGTITAVTHLSGAEVERGDRFGESLAVSRNVALVGQLGDDFGAGTVVAFDRAGGGWTENGVLVGTTSGLDPIVGGQVDCADGEAASFGCGDVDLLSFLPVGEIGGGRGVQTNDVWGWTDPETGIEYALVGMSHATAFIDIGDPYNPKFLGTLPRTDGSPGSTWRDIKVYKDHAYIVSDNAGAHGMQVFDLTQLREVSDPPVTFEEAAHYDGIFSAHNVVINEESGFAYSVGSSSGGETCGGGLHMIDIRQPERPTFAGCFADTSTGFNKTGYTHDAQCVIYKGPDADHVGKEVCFGANETALSIADVTDKSNPTAIAVATYPNVGYAHQGWLTEDQRYFFMDDEGDEFNDSFGLTKTRTLVWDVTDLDDPVLVTEHMGETFTSDHNLYVKGELMYQSNYVSGLRILDISDPENPKEVAFFDTVPYDESPGFNGSWSNYPFFESGTIVVTSGKEGVFFLKKREGLTP
jgi:choice-of-anchor B domain-containing protein